MGVVPAVVPTVWPKVFVLPRLDMAVPRRSLLGTVVSHGCCTLRFSPMTSLLPCCCGLVGGAGFLTSLLRTLLRTLLRASLLRTLFHTLLLLLALGPIGLLLSIPSTLLLSATTLCFLFALASSLVLKVNLDHFFFSGNRLRAS